MDANTITAMCALFVSVLATVIAAWSAHAQRIHMRLSIRPIAAVPVADFDNRIGVFLKNKGLGPMRITSLRVTDNNGTTHDDILSHMPTSSAGIPWDNYYDSVDGETLENGKRFELLLLTGNVRDLDFRAFRDEVRRKLKDLTVTIEYEDFYGKAMLPIKEKLSWFGRHGLVPTSIVPTSN